MSKRKVLKRQSVICSAFILLLYFFVSYFAVLFVFESELRGFVTDFEPRFPPFAPLESLGLSEKRRDSSVFPDSEGLLSRER